MTRLPPGRAGPPLVGETLAFLRNPFRFLEIRQQRYGDVFRSHVLGRPVVFLAGTEGAESFYDEENISRTDAHPYPLVDLFGGDNMEMLDGSRHLALKSAALTSFGDDAIEDLPRLRRTDRVGPHPVQRGRRASPRRLNSAVWPSRPSGAT